MTMIIKMKCYSIKEIKKSLDFIGLNKGDLLYVNPELYKR